MRIFDANAFVVRGKKRTGIGAARQDTSNLRESAAEKAEPGRYIDRRAASIFFIFKAILGERFNETPRTRERLDDRIDFPGNIDLTCAHWMAPLYQARHGSMQMLISKLRLHP